MKLPQARALSAVLVLSALSWGASLRADEGMWPFNHLPRAALKKRYDFTLSDQWLSRVQKSSVRVAGCSGSFVSSTGLTLTNHHCAQECLSRLSSAKKDYFEQGYYAATPADELVCPGAEIHQLTEIQDVTQRIQSATRGLDGEAFKEALKGERARIEKACATSEDLNCEVVSLYHGGLYELYQYRRYRDVRLVFAPEAAIAFFGGDPDNFNFPRYDLDLTFLRAYSGGKPVATPDYLPWSSKPLAPNDLTFVSGNPGSTERLLTVAQLEYVRDHELVEQLLSLARYRGFLTEYQQRGAEARRVSTSELFNVENGFKALRGEHQALSNDAFFERLRAREHQLRAQVRSNAELQSKYGNAWEAIERGQAREAELALEWRWIEGGGGRPSWSKTSLFGWARSLVRAADERVKPNEQRLPEYADARLPGLEQRLLAARPLDTAFEIAKLSFGLSTLREELGSGHPFVRQVLGRLSPEELASELVRGSQLGSVAERKRLWQADKSAITASKDRMIQLALAIDAEARRVRARYENEVDAVVTKNSELVAQARFAVYGMTSYPDATLSARLSFGTVRGWRERGEWVPAFTTIGGAFDRATGRAPFALPKSWLAHRAALDLATPFNFVTDNDIIGGNSGSPVINRDGELVGLVFDGNIHSLGGAFGFDIAKNRMIAVDARAITHTLEHVYAAKRLSSELSGSAPGAGRGTAAQVAAGGPVERAIDPRHSSIKPGADSDPRNMLAGPK